MRPTLTVLTTVFVGSLLAPPAAAQDCEPVGSPIVSRPNNDSSPGLVLIYRGPTSPVSGPGEVESWRFYSGGPVGSVTPLLFRVEASGAFTLIGVGTSRPGDGTGVQAHPFGLIVGTDQLDAGVQYTFGFTHRGLEAGPGPGQIIQNTVSAGVVDYDGYNIFTDPWDYAVTGLITLGSLYGPGGIALNSLGLPGRIYSARFFLACDCPADLAPPFGELNFFDVSAFLSAYNAQDPVADFAAPSGVFNFFDVSAFLSAYNAGCP